MIVKLNETHQYVMRYVNLANATIINMSPDKEDMIVYWNYLQPTVDGESTVDYERFHGDQARQLIAALDRLSI